MHAILAQVPSAGPGSDSFNITVGQRLIEVMTGQSDLLQSLALATFGGAVGLLWAIVQHNQKEEGKNLPPLKYTKLLIAGMACIGLSMGCGYLLRGALVSEVPKLLGLPYSKDTGFDHMQCEYPDGWLLGVLALLQAMLYLSGVILMAVTFVTNLLKWLPKAPAATEKPPNKQE